MDKIKIVIAARRIDKIAAETGVKIDIDEEGNVPSTLTTKMPSTVLKENHCWSVQKPKVTKLDAKVVRIEKLPLSTFFDKTDAPHHTLKWLGHVPIM